MGLSQTAFVEELSAQLTFLYQVFSDMHVSSEHPLTVFFEAAWVAWEESTASTVKDALAADTQVWLCALSFNTIDLVEIRRDTESTF
jgi:hypothetical protein